MSQHDLDIADQTGPDFLIDINSVLAALITGHSGATEPPTTFPFMLWNDTGTSKKKQRNAADNDWEILSPLINKAPEVVSDTGRIALRFPAQSFQICANKITTGNINNAIGSMYRSAELPFFWLSPFNSTPFAWPGVMQGSDNTWATLGGTSINATTGSVRAMAPTSTAIALIAVIGVGTYTPAP